MRRLLSSLAVISFALASTPASADKMDLPLKMLVRSPAVGKVIFGKAVSKAGDGAERADILVKSLDPSLTAAEIESAGGAVRSTIGDIMTALVPIDFLQALADREEVLGLEASKQMRELLDSARQNARADEVQAGSADGTGYSGEDVVVGIIDSGLDYSRGDFDDISGNTRVQYLRFQSILEGSIYITECARDYIMNGTCASSIPASNDSSLGHGTHVTGIAAGNGGGTDYIGMAPQADIMLVRNTYISDVDEGTGSFSSGLLDGVAEIFKKSDTLDKPAVINISQGTHIGAHDDTSLMEQGMNNAIAGQYADGGKGYGRSIVAAAGNEHVVDGALGSLAAYAGGVHAAFSVSDGSSHAWRVWSLAEPGRSPLLVDAWFGTGQAGGCSVAVKGYDYATGSFTNTDTANAAASVGDLAMSSDNDATTSTTSDSKAYVVIATDAQDSQNSKPRALIGYGPIGTGTWDDLIVSDSDGDSTLDSGFFIDVIIRASGGSCTGDMWIEGGGTDAHFMKGLDTIVTVSGTGNYSIQDGDNNKTVGLPGTATGVIAVGAYLQPKPYGSSGSRWTDIGGTGHDATDIANEPVEAQVNGGTVGQRCPFSSIGPTADGRQKPDILAPGDPMISVMPTGYSPDTALKADETHYKSQGTSQAAPAIAGIVALLFDKNNTLTSGQALAALTSTADSSYTGYSSSGDGYGKVNASAAIQSISADSSGYSGTGDLTQSDISDDDDGNGSSSSSSSGCGSMIVPASTTSVGLVLLFVVVPVGVMGYFRRGRKEANNFK